MSVDAVAAISTTGMQSLTEVPSNLDFNAVESGNGVSFDSVVGSLEALNDKLVSGADAVHALALGQIDNLHQVMMAGEQTRLAFDLMLQVRGKVLDAYQELLRMPL
jgi:flagellar hook-basal body complex protein FliE